ncbi:MAG: Tryptophan synthase alpha chain [Labilithrix sp.]|nr:Tryptophan synthase alpha chain [Labilithrix sp.]
MRRRGGSVVLGVVFLGALVFACTSPVNDDVVISGRPETPAFTTPDGGVTVPEAEAGVGLCASNECPEGHVTCPNRPYPCTTTSSRASSASPIAWPVLVA